VASLEKLLHDFVAEKQIKTGDVIHAIRVATTGKSVGPGLYDCLEILGKEKCLQRIDQALAMVT
jgi:glutamyl-tRNA synthetase